MALSFQEPEGCAMIWLVSTPSILSRPFTTDRAGVGNSSTASSRPSTGMAAAPVRQASDRALALFLDGGMLTLSHRRYLRRPCIGYVFRHYPATARRPRHPRRTRVQHANYEFFSEWSGCAGQGHHQGRLHSQALTVGGDGRGSRELARPPPPMQHHEDHHPPERH